MSESALQIGTASGEQLAAVLRLPDGVVADGNASGGVPAVLLCQGLSGVKHLVLPEVADALATVGIASLRFDYAGCGESSGSPGWIDPPRRAADAASALAALADRPEVDAHRLGVYGHSYGGPVALAVAAADRRVRAAVAVSGPGAGADLLRAARPGWDWLALLDRVETERASIAAGHPPTVVPLSDLLPFSPAFLAAYEKLRATGGSSAMAASGTLGVDHFYLASVDRMLASHPADDARRLAAVAVLLVHGAADDVAPVETIAPVHAALAGTKRLVLVPEAGHNDLDGGAGLAHAAQLACDWFVEHLA